MVVVLVGSMGVGKTSIGVALAKHIGAPFADLDALIAEHTGEPVASLFDRVGELAFRKLERQVALKMLGSAPSKAVLALGGGTFTDFDVRLECRRRAKTVYLRATPSAVWARLGESSVAGRPLLSGDGARVLAERHAKRDPVYLRSDAVVNANVALPAVLEQVLRYA